MLFLQVSLQRKGSEIAREKQPPPLMGEGEVSLSAKL